LFRPEPGVPLAEVAKTKQPFQIADIRSTKLYLDGNPLAVSAVNEAAMLAVVAVPMIKEDQLIGAVAIYSKVARPFSEKQIELLENFAAQAVIAIENARLLSELRQRTTDLTERTGDLTEALEQQTATSEVLQVISSSPGDLEPVFAAMLEKAVRICDAKFGTLYLYDEGGLRLIAAHDVPAAFEEVRAGAPIPPAPGGLFDDVIKTGTTVHLPDMAATKPYAERHPRVVEAVELGGIRTVVAVPMLKENSAPLHRQADRSSHQLRRSGGHRHRERTAAQRAKAVFRAADGYVAGAAGYLKLTRRPSARFCNDARERHAHLRGQIRCALP
jgi:GAF domain-containing protein